MIKLIKQKYNALVFKVKKFFKLRFTITNPQMTWLSDKTYLKKYYKHEMGKELDLSNPKTLTEKLQWLKLYNRKPIYTSMVDKHLAKEFVANIVGEEHVIPTLGVWDKYDDIDFESLPNEFVLKCTHDSGGYKICKDKNKINHSEYKEYFDYRQKQNFYKHGREWPYKNVKPRIIAEPFIEYLGNSDSIEYKTTCFDGKVGFVTICTGIAHTDFDKRFNDHFDKDFNKMEWYVNYKPAPVTPKKPKQWDELIDFCEKISVGVPYLRVDTYIIDGKILFGEMTFFTWAGFMKFVPEEWDRKLGDMLTLPRKRFHF